jgi:aminoglycoside 3-N-acetyltransferase
MFTEKDLIHDIQALGIESGDLLTVHTSLKAIGEIEANGKTGAEVVIDALRFCVRNGILMIPTRFWGRKSIFAPKLTISLLLLRQKALLK